LYRSIFHVKVSPRSALVATS